MTSSVEWGELPAALRRAIEERTGRVNGASAGGEGMSSILRLVLHADGGDVFVKGTMPGERPDRVHRLALGAALAPYVTAVSPPLLWQVQAVGWNVTGWPALPGRPWADQKPDSPDVPKMAGLLAILAGIPAPPLLTVTARDAWGGYADDPAALDGDALVHRDPNPTNFIIDGDRAWMVDFGWAVRGPAWLTAAQLTLSMMEAGWDAAAAEKALAEIPAWDAAPPLAVGAFAEANARSWDAAVNEVPSKVRRFRAAVARAWASHRAAIADI